LLKLGLLLFLVLPGCQTLTTWGGAAGGAAVGGAVGGPVGAGVGAVVGGVLLKEATDELGYGDGGSITEPEMRDLLDEYNEDLPLVNSLIDSTLAVAIVVTVLTLLIRWIRKRRDNKAHTPSPT